MREVILNESHSFIVEKTADGWVVNGEPIKADIVPLGNGRYHILFNHRSYVFTTEKNDLSPKHVTIRVNDQRYDLLIRDENDLLAEKIGVKKETVIGQDELTAPMPGLIVDIMVKEGQTVERGTPLVILKAMKMENILKAGHKATVKKINVREDEKIDKGANILLFENPGGE